MGSATRDIQVEAHVPRNGTPHELSTVLTLSLSPSSHAQAQEDPEHHAKRPGGQGYRGVSLS